MSYIIPVFAFPVLETLKLYKSMQLEVPIERGTHSFSNSQRVYKKDVDYNDTISLLPGHNIKVEMTPFLSQEEIRKDLIIAKTYVNKYPPAAAFDPNCYL